MLRIMVSIYADIFHPYRLGSVTTAGASSDAGDHDSRQVPTEEELQLCFVRSTFSSKRLKDGDTGYVTFQTINGFRDCAYEEWSMNATKHCNQQRH
jgi:hypothetical protein